MVSLVAEGGSLFDVRSYPLKQLVNSALIWNCVMRVDWLALHTFCYCSARVCLLHKTGRDSWPCVYKKHSTLKPKHSTIYIYHCKIRTDETDTWTGTVTPNVSLYLGSIVECCSQARSSPHNVALFPLCALLGVSVNGSKPILCSAARLAFHRSSPFRPVADVSSRKNARMWSGIDRCIVC